MTSPVAKPRVALDLSQVRVQVIPAKKRRGHKARPLTQQALQAARIYTYSTGR